MTLYALLVGMYSDRDLAGIYSSLEAAQAQHQVKEPEVSTKNMCRGPFSQEWEEYEDDGPLRRWGYDSHGHYAEIQEVVLDASVETGE